MGSPCCLSPSNVLVLYAVRIVSKESGRLVLPGTCFINLLLQDAPRGLKCAPVKKRAGPDVSIGHIGTV
jgi:hypothetical protein